MPDRIVVDSDVVIDALHAKVEAVQALKEIEERARLAVSAISEMELIVGLRNKNESRTLDNFLMRFEIIPLNERSSTIATELLKRYHLSHGLLIPDALIAATAISTNLQFVSKNVRDYRFIPELKLLPYPEPFAKIGELET